MTPHIALWIFDELYIWEKLAIFDTFQDLKIENMNKIEYVLRIWGI